MSVYVFQLGRETGLALAELAAVLPAAVSYIDGTAQTVIVGSQTELDLQKLQDRLGGTIKIGRILRSFSGTFSQTVFQQAVIDDVLTRPVRDFGVSLFGTSLWLRARDEMVLKIKRALKEAGQSTRFVASRDLELSSVLVRAQLLKNGREFWGIQTTPAWYLAETVTVQDWQAWSRRDYGRPARDARRGMLPPKLARMMINLARVPLETILLDPFCGVGTVLMEAAVLGYQRLMGGDRDEQAIEATRANWQWLLKQDPKLASVKIELAATPLEQLSPTAPVAAVVSEADLGPSTLAHLGKEQRIDYFQQLAPRYQAWLEKLFHLLTNRGVVVLAYPILLAPRTELPIVEFAKDIGWQVTPLISRRWSEHPSFPKHSDSVLTYARPDQLIGRKIIRLSV